MDKDDFIKKTGREHEYTQEQIKELVKCKNDVLYFCNNYVKIVSIDHGVMLFDTYDYQNDLLTKFAKHRFNIALLSRQSGKCVYEDISIKLRNKKTGEIKEISIGDFYNTIKEKHSLKTPIK